MNYLGKGKYEGDVVEGWYGILIIKVSWKRSIQIRQRCNI